MKILILKPSSLGDVVQALPVLRLLKRHLPSSEIYWWIDSRLAPLLEGDPQLAGIVRFERQRWAAPNHWGELWRSVQWVRAQRFDWVIDLQCLARSAVFAWLANGKLTIGLDEPREFARGFYDLIVRRTSYHTHAVDWYLAVLQRLDIPVDGHFEWIRAHHEIAAELAQRFPVNGSRWIAIQPGARWQNKRWPAEHYGQVVQKLAAEDPTVKFVILGSSDEQALANEVAQVDRQRCVNLAGKTTLAEMTEWIRRSTLMLTNDTGPMHIAVALGKPVVAILGPTEPRRTGPYGQLHHVLQAKLGCVPCMKPRCRNKTVLECLHVVSPEKVFESARQLLKQ